MRKPALLVWQAFSFPVAYVSANVYLNVNNYVDQIDRFFGTGSGAHITENAPVALTVFLILFLFPNVHVFASLRSLKNDLLNDKLQPDVSIIPRDNYVEISGKEYKSIRETGLTPFGFTLISLFPLIMSYSSLVPVLAFLTVITLIGLSYPGTVFITANPYLRSKYNVYVLRNNDRTLYIITEKEKEFERPNFSDYIIDWLYDRKVLIGFRKRE
jgi:hypothetical protein